MMFQMNLTRASSFLPVLHQIVRSNIQPHYTSKSMELRPFIEQISVAVTLYVYVRFEVFTGVTMKNAVFWDVTPCRSCVNRRFGGTYRLLQGRKIYEQGTSVSCWAPAHIGSSQIFLPWRWRRYVPPKRLFTQVLHGGTSQKMAFFSRFVFER
jgi:hypothetical protein